MPKTIVKLEYLFSCHLNMPSVCIQHSHSQAHEFRRYLQESPGITPSDVTDGCSDASDSSCFLNTTETVKETEAICKLIVPIEKQLEID